MTPNKIDPRLPHSPFSIFTESILLLVARANSLPAKMAEGVSRRQLNTTEGAPDDTDR